ncbi:MAG: AroM family protein [Acidobacteriota bacterium]
MSVLGLATIGQTPRPDLVRAFGAAAPATRILVRGALDGLARAEVAALEQAGDYPLLVRLADGATAEIPMAVLHPRVERAVAALEADGADATVVVCAGRFPAVRAARPVLLPGEIVPAVLRAITRTGRIGVVTPNAGQVPFAERKWRGDGFDPVVSWAAPGAADDLARAAAALSGRDLELVVLDCMGHDEADRAAFARLTGRPVVAAQTLVTHVAAAVVG